jgi:hypothetical protein
MFEQQQGYGHKLHHVQGAVGFTMVMMAMMRCMYPHEKRYKNK